MDRELRRKLNEAPVVERRGIYEFKNASETYFGLCLVVAGEHRAWDKYISVISLTPYDLDMSNHGDELGLKLPDGTEWICHCGMVTYMRRDRLGRMVHKLSIQTMNRIDKGIQQELGFVPKAGYSSSTDPDYEKMYNDLLKTIAGWNQHEAKKDTQ